jgi:uncharacterized protein (UPF0276 family)
MAAVHNPIPAGTAGIGLRPPHYRDLLAARPALGFVEVHSENYFGAGGAPLHYLERAREQYPVSLHGVGLSLGSTDALSVTHLRALKQLIVRIEPVLVSDHLCWCSVEDRYLNDLLPLPCTGEALAHVVGRIAQAQEFLGVRLLIENPSSYLAWRHSDMPEGEFLAAVAAQADCDILLDVNNVYVSSRNLGFDARAYLRALPPARVREIHLAGHAERRFPEGTILIDTHDAPVCDAVWELYREAVTLFPAAPALIERDARLPALDELVGEARRADRIHERADDNIAA